MSGNSDQGRGYQDVLEPDHQDMGLAYMSNDLDPHPQSDTRPPSPHIGSLPSSAQSSQHLERPAPPTRASTVSTPHAYDQRKPRADGHPHARSEDLNHSSVRTYNDPSTSDFTSLASTRSRTFLTASRPTTPASSSNHLTSDNGEPSQIRPGSSHSDSSAYSDPSTPGGSAPAGTSTTHTSNSTASTPCSACGKAMQGAFVRALGTVYHLNCFKCMDCGTVVASKFFPIDGPDGRQHPLCERDYFRRLNLICAKCGMALRGSYITACNKKYHVEHFTCSVCPTLFGPQDSYYEHDGDVYCHFHYSTRFATKCAGCSSAILKQFVEINRNSRDECWHPECYMINKFWNVKVVSRRPPASYANGIEEGDGNVTEPPYAEEERRETHVSLKDKQIRMEQQVYRIWTVLSAFEESSAACISEMLRQVSGGQYSDAIRMAEKFILHVEVLFATIDDLEWHFARLKLKGLSHVREARMLCRKTVDLFTLLSHTQESGARRMGMTQELLALVTGLAHYLKILIRIALTGALKLEREQEVPEAINSFLDKLHMLAIQGGTPSAKRMMKRANGEIIGEGGGNAGTQGVTYGFKSLAPENAGESPFAAGPRDPALARVGVVNPPSDLCVKCNLTVEEDCVRLGTYQRWHSHCIQCQTCGKQAAAPVAKDPPQSKNLEDKDKKDDAPKLSTARRPPANVGEFVYEVDSMREMSAFGLVPMVILCIDHAHANCRSGFQSVSRLEQYAFLLNVALRRLYVLLKKRGVITSAPLAQAPRDPQEDPYRNSGDINRLKSVHLDRKLSATARVPKRSTIVESPTGRVAQPTDVMQTQRSQDVRVAQQVQPMSGKQHQQHRPLQAPGPSRAQQLVPSGSLDTMQGQVLRPAFARNNTEVMIVDDSPISPSGAVDEGTVGGVEDGITLADIPQIVEAAQAREQHRSLPRESSIPFIAELNPVELAIVKHCAVLVLMRSPLRDQMELDEILEMVEIKKTSFWNKIFKPGNDKKNLKKKGVEYIPLPVQQSRPQPRGRSAKWTALLFLVSACLFTVARTSFCRSTLFKIEDVDVEAELAGLCPQAEPLVPEKNNELWTSLSETYGTDAFLERAVNWLGGAVRVPTPSFDEMGPVGVDPRWEVFAPFHDYLVGAYPQIHATLGLTKVNTYGLVYYWKGSDESLKPLLLTAHQDVVPVNPDTYDRWEHPPFSGYFDGTKIWGRGSKDDKSGLIGVMSAIESLIELGFKPTRSVVLAFGFDEETSGKHGAYAIGKYLEKAYGDDSFAMLVDEGGKFGEEHGGVFAHPSIAEKGYIDIRLTVTSPGGHSSVPPPHTSIGILAALLVEYEENPSPAILRRDTPTYWTAQCLAAHAPVLAPDLRKAIARSAKSDAALQEAAELLYAEDRTFKALVETTQAIDLINGGVKTNALPENAEAIINHRIATDSSVSVVKGRATQLFKGVAHNFNLSYNAFGAQITEEGAPAFGTLTLADAYGTALEPAPITPTGEDAAPYQLLSGSIKATYASHRGLKEDEIVVAPSLVSGNTDTRYYWKLTPHIFRYSHSNGRSGNGLDGVHTVNEAIYADSFVEIVRWFTTLILNADESTSI